MAGDNGRQTREPGPWLETGRYMGLGLQWALSVLLFLLAGWWLDVRLGTGPVLLVTGALVGGAAGFYSLYRQIVGEPRETANEEDR